LPKAKLFYLIGGDNVNEFSSWKNSEDIFELSKVVVYDRNKNIKQQLGKFEFVKSPLIDISSSKIRECVKTHTPYKNFLHPAVFDYIKKNKLYTSK
jgi:nicotinate-nucleotide adenylyltransferase